MYSAEEARAIAHQFCLDDPVDVEDFVGKGNINLDTVLVTAGLERKRYLLQRINHEVFPMPHRVMHGMIATLQAQKDAIERGVVQKDDWRPIELVPTRSGELYFVGESDIHLWRMMEFIEGTSNYKSLGAVGSSDREQLAHEVGRGLAVYSDLTSSLQPGDAPASLPGYRNTEIYYAQFRAAVSGNREPPILLHPQDLNEDERIATAPHYVRSETHSDEILAERLRDPDVARAIDAVLEAEGRVMAIRYAMASGQIRQTVIHGDTKIENFLFDSTSGRAVALVDLDTIMPLTWLADWGDMIRSLVNVAGEKERNTDNVRADLAIYAAVANGFLGSASSPTDAEINLMTRAAETLALETGMRFLADYLRGETYFKLGPNDPPDLNKTRALVQIKLYQDLCRLESEAASIIERARRTG